MKLFRYGIGVALGVVIGVGSAAGGAATGALAITSEPSAAAVYLDGRFIGQTPIDVPDVTTGDHRVRLVKDGFLEHSRVVNVDSGKSGSVEVRLTRRAAQSTTAQKAGLKIVVIEGEDAVNVIQQKTAVAPVVEVRDRNNQPVAGAQVKFEIKGGRASFNGSRTLTTTTNTAGRAAVSSMTPTGSGAFQIVASTVFQGQTVVATIAQTNFMTLAAAGAAAGAAGAGAAGAGGAAAAGGAASGGATAAGAAGGAAAGAGGGVSAATIGIIGGAVAGGTFAAKQVLGGGSSGGITIYEGDFRIDGVNSIRQVRGNGTVALSCSPSLSLNGEVRAEIEELQEGTLTGTVSANGYYAQGGSACSASTTGNNEKISFGSANVTGTTANFQASSQNRAADGVGFSTLSFSGALNGGVITGTFTISQGYKTVPDAGGFYSEASFPATSTQVTLTK